MSSGVTPQMVATVLNKSWFSAKKIPFLKSFEKLKKSKKKKKNSASKGRLRRARLT